MRLAGHRAGEQRLARTRRTVQKHPVGHSPPQTLVPLGRAQEVDDLGQLALGVIDPGHIAERHADLVRIDPASLGAAKPAQRTHPAGRRPAGQQPEKRDEQKRRAESQEDLGQDGSPLGLGVYLHPL